VPVSSLLNPARHVGHRWALTRWPDICVGVPERHVVCGLIYDVLQTFYAVAGVSLPSRGP
jgi:hypothetical protein